MGINGGDPAFWARVDKSGECWEWLGSKTSAGYGTVGRRPVTYLAHRYAWQLTHGEPPPPGMCLCHTCDNPGCVRPEHLFLGTRADNNQDRSRKGRGHIGEQHPSAKLTAEKVRAIRASYEDGATQKAIAAEFGISQIAVSRVVRRVAWRAVD